MIHLLASSAFVAALVLGFRHGFDWDHLAALSDLTGSQASPRRSMTLASLYVLGHAVMILVLGSAAILFAERVPSSVDSVMEHVVGVTLIGLGLWIAWTALRTGGVPPARSRWMVLLTVIGRVGRRRAGEPIVIEHSHPHDHGHPMHVHTHTEIALEPPERGQAVTKVAHAHAHRHVAVVPLDPFIAYGRWSSFGIGLLHGVGAETPTQLLVFAAAAHSSGRPASIGLLVCFVVGLVVSNTLVAAASTLGYRGVLRHRVVSAALAAVTAIFSLVVGSLLLFGQSASLPSILGG